MTEPHPAGGWWIAWGEQLDVRPLRLRGDGDVTDRAVVAYLAKYATKSTESTGHVSKRLTASTVDYYADPYTHAGRLVDACWTLGGADGWDGLRRWAHMLGFGGHFGTRSRRYSTTLWALPVPAAVVEQLAEHRQTSRRPSWCSSTRSVGRSGGRASGRGVEAGASEGLPEGLRFHDLRHSYATWLVSEGVPPNVVQRIIGHEDVTTTLGIYADVPVDYVQRVEDALVVGPLWIEPAEEPEDEEDPSEEGPSAAERRGRGDRI